MENLDQNAQQDLPSLRQWVNDLLRLANSVLEQAQYSEDDHFGFMALCFLSKQTSHTRSILTLGEAKDVGLIARSMLEGLCQLLWAANDPHTRALRWRAFAWVHDWRTMQTQIAAGESVNAEQGTAIEEALRHYGDQFLTRRARAARQGGERELDDPYCSNWTGHSVRQIFDWVKGERLYARLYKPFSDWHHWSPSGLATAVSSRQGGVVYSSTSVADAATALATAFQCLLRTIDLADGYLGLGFAPRVAELRRNYITWHQAQRGPQI